MGYWEDGDEDTGDAGRKMRPAEAMGAHRFPVPFPPRPHCHPVSPSRPPRSRGGYVALSQVAEDGRLSPSSGR